MLYINPLFFQAFNVFAPIYSTLIWINVQAAFQKAVLKTVLLNLHRVVAAWWLIDLLNLKLQPGATGVFKRKMLAGGLCAISDRCFISVVLEARNLLCTSACKRRWTNDGRTSISRRRSYGKCQKPLASRVASFWVRSIRSMSFCKCGDIDCTVYSRNGRARLR